MGRGLLDNSLKYHLETAKKNGITAQEIAKIITNAGFYTGWPMTLTVFNLAKSIWTKKKTLKLVKSNFSKSSFFQWESQIKPLQNILLMSLF